MKESTRPISNNPHDLTADEFKAEWQWVTDENEKLRQELENAEPGYRVTVNAGKSQSVWVKVEEHNSQYISWVEIYTGKTCGHWTVLWGKILWESWKSLAPSKK